MNFYELLMLIPAAILVVAVPWIGMILGARSFDKRIDKWRADYRASLAKEVAAEEVSQDG